MIKELRSQHRNILHMSFNGFSNNDIAERLEMSHITVSNIIRSPLGQAYLNGLQDKAQQATLDVRKELINLNKDAIATFTRLLNPKEKAPPSVQFNAAKDILDRNGFKAPDKLNIDMTLQAKTDAEIDAEILAMEQSLKRTQQQLENNPTDKSGTENNIINNSDSLTNDSSDSPNVSNIKNSPNKDSVPDLLNNAAINAAAAAAINETMIHFDNPIDHFDPDHPDYKDSSDNIPDDSLLNSIPKDIFQKTID